jgi:hypothetical protein
MHTYTVSNPFAITAIVIGGLAMLIPSVIGI